MSHQDPPPVDPNSTATKTAFIPLESNPIVFNNLAYNLGLSPSLSFTDVYSLTDADLLAFVPRPAHALILVFPVSKTYEDLRKNEDGGLEEYKGAGEGEPVVWFKQTIKNACGMIGLLHAMTNGSARDQILPSSNLDSLLSSALPLPPLDRAKLLENSKELATAHKSAATAGDTAAPDANDDVELHFVCFVKSKKDNKLYELDGRRKGPLARTTLEQDEDVLSDRARTVVTKFMESATEDGNLNFGLVALVEGGEF